MQRALSLSSSESKDARSQSRSGAGDTTENESLQDGNDCSGDHENSNSADESVKETLRERRMISRHETDLEIQGQTQLSGDSNAVALECVAE